MAEEKRREAENRVTKNIEGSLARICNELGPYLQSDVSALQGRLVQLFGPGSMDESKIRFIDLQVRAKDCLSLLSEGKRYASRLGLGTSEGSVVELLSSIEKQMDSLSLFNLIRRIRQGVVRIQKAKEEIINVYVTMVAYSLLIKVGLRQASEQMARGEKAEVPRLVGLTMPLLDKLRALLSSWEGYINSSASSFEPTGILRDDWSSAYLIYNSVYSLMELRKPNPLGDSVEFGQYIAKRGRYWEELSNAVGQELDMRRRMGEEIFKLDDFCKNFSEKFVNTEAKNEDIKGIVLKLKGDKIWGVDQSPNLGEVVLTFDPNQAEERAYEILKGRELSYIDEFKKELGWREEKVKYVLSSLESKGRVAKYRVGQDVVYKVE